MSLSKAFANVNCLKHFANVIVCGILANAKKQSVANLTNLKNPFSELAEP
jgi:hypothetical protein